MDGAISAKLRAFVDEAPGIREPSLTYLQAAAHEIPAGSRVLDVGAGEAPFRELFNHTQYVTLDWPGSIYAEAQGADILASADDIPVENSSFDAVLCTQVLEHVPDVDAVVAELHRVLIPGGRLYVTVPMTWYLHEEPYDFRRLTSHGLHHALTGALFSEIDIRPMNDSFTTLAQLLDHAGHLLGTQHDGYDDQRHIAARTLRLMAPIVGSFGHFDSTWLLPLSFSATARRAT